MKALLHALALSLALTLPAVASASEPEGHGQEAAAHGETHEAATPDKSFAFSVVNFVLLAALLVYGYKKFGAETFPQRRAQIAQAMEEAARAKAEAEAKYKDYRERVSNLEREIEALKATYRGDAETEKAAIVAAAREAAERMKVQAERTATLEVAKARSELRAEAAALAIDLAERIVTERINAEDQERLVREYVEKLEA